MDVVIDKPAFDTVDVLLAYHGTVSLDSKILEAANTTLDKVRGITTSRNTLIISVAYPEEGLQMGDNLRESEAALLWVKNRAALELGVAIRKIFLVGHSQGGYIVTRLNTLHATDGVIANGPGPLNLLYRCQLEENNQAPVSAVCTLLQSNYGNTQSNPAAYNDRSLLHFTGNYQSRVLFVQGLLDSPIQLASWPAFKQQVENCPSCAPVQVLEISGFGHTALFDSPQAIGVYNEFIGR